MPCPALGFGFRLRPLPGFLRLFCFGDVEADHGLHLYMRPAHHVVRSAAVIAGDADYPAETVVCGDAFGVAALPAAATCSITLR